MNTGTNYSSGVSANKVKIMESVPEALQRHKETQTVSLFSVTSSLMQEKSWVWEWTFCADVQVQFSAQNAKILHRCSFTGVQLHLYNYTCKILNLSFNDGRLYLQQVSPRSWTRPSAAANKHKQIVVFARLRCQTSQRVCGYSPWTGRS